MRKYWGLLRYNRNIRALWLGETISSFGDFFYDIAIMWYVFSKTGSGLQTGLIMVLTFLPQALAAPLFGVYADRFNRKRLMQIGSTIQASLMSILTVLIYFSAANLVVIYIITVMMAISQLAYGPARSGMFPDLVPVENLMTANSLFSISQQVARLFGSTAGGAIITLIGATSAVGFDAVTFLISILCVGRINYVQKENDHVNPINKTIVSDLRVGWNWLISKPAILTLILIGTFCNVALGPSNVLPPMLIKNDLHHNAAALGGFDASIGLGIILGGIVVGSLSVSRIGTLFCAGIGIQGLGMAIVAISPTFWLACVGNFVLGVAVAMTLLPMDMMFQTLIPGDVRGRINAISSSLFTISIPITYAGIGLLGDTIGARWSYGLGAVLLFLCMVVGLTVPTVRGQAVSSVFSAEKSAPETVPSV